MGVICTDSCCTGMMRRDLVIGVPFPDVRLKIQTGFRKMRENEYVGFFSNSDSYASQSSNFSSLITIRAIQST